MLGAAFEAPLDCCAYATASFRDSKPPTPTFTHARALVQEGAECPARRTGSDIKIYHFGQRLAPLLFLCLEVKMVSVPRVEKIFIFRAKVL